MAASLNNPAWLEWMATLMGGGSRHSDAASFPPHRFYCLLDDLPLHLIPQPAKRVELYSHGERPELLGPNRVAPDPIVLNPVVLNPECLLLPAGQLPEPLRLREDLLAGFARQGTIAWVRDAASGSLLPFWLGPRLESTLRNLMAGTLVPAALDAGDRALLLGAGILRSPHQTSRPQRDGVAKRMSACFQAKGYAPLAGLIHPFHVAALRRYYRYLIRTGAIRLGDGQSSRRYVAYNEPVARFFHQSLAATFSAVAGEPLKPSYVYMASYLSGAELKKHTDREQCEFSITFCLDFSPEPEFGTPWPIQLDTGGGTVTVYQALGDGLAYRGTRLPHYRGVLGEGKTSTSIFFHYVPADFAGSLD
jgi:hypothetical protein